MFKAELYNLIRHLAGEPASIMQMIVVLVLGIVVCVLVFEKLNSVLGTPLTGIGLSVTVLLIAAIVLIHMLWRMWRTNMTRWPVTTSHTKRWPSSVPHTT